MRMEDMEIGVNVNENEMKIQVKWIWCTHVEELGFSFHIAKLLIQTDLNW